MKEIGKEFRELMNKLLTELSKRTSDGNVRNLILRLDFNRFYAKSSLPKVTPTRPLADPFISTDL